MQQQQRWIAYRKDAVLICDIFWDCDKNMAAPVCKVKLLCGLVPLLHPDVRRNA